MTAKVVPIGLRRQINDQLRAALEGMPVAVSWASIEDGRVLFANRKHLETFGHGIGDTPTISDFLNRVVVDKQWAKVATEGLQAIIAQHPTKRLELPATEQDVLCKDGSRKTILFSSAVLPEAGWIITTCLDVTDSRAREQLSHRLATLDPLTGLLIDGPSRNGWQLQSAVRCLM